MQQREKAGQGSSSKRQFHSRCMARTRTPGSQEAHCVTVSIRLKHSTSVPERAVHRHKCRSRDPGTVCHFALPVASNCNLPQQTRMTKLDIEHLFELAARRQWDAVQRSLAANPHTARCCAHHVQKSSGWSLLHHAASSGNEAAARQLIRHGANPVLVSKADGTPADVADETGHGALAALLRGAAMDGDWAPPASPSHWPSSCAAAEAAIAEVRRGYACLAPSSRPACL